MKSEKDPFDKIIQEKLNDFDASSGLPDWDRMEELLEQDESSAASDFDRMAAEKLRRMEPPYDPGHWDMMARRIDEAFSIRHWMHRYHVPELALMILFFFTLIQYLNRMPDQSGFAPVPKPAAVPVMPVQTPQRPQAAADIPPPASDVVSPVVASVQVVEPLASITPLAVVVSQDEPPQPRFLINGVMPGLPGLKPLPQGAGLTAIASLPKRAAGGSNWYVGAYSGLDYNAVYSPMDDVFQTDSYWTDSLGYRAGVLVSWEHKKWGVQSGITFANVAYQPLLPEQQYGNFEHLVVEKFEEISYQFLQIPLEVRRSFLPERSRWDVYLLGGVEANLIVDALYDIDKTEVISSRSVLPEPNLAEQSKLGEKTFPEGIFNGGRFFHNTYLSFSVGMGVERTMFDRWKLFAEPVFSRPFPGHEVRPNEDQIHQFSLRVGAKYRVKGSANK